MVEYPTTHARERPDHPAVIDVRDGSTLTYGRLEERSRAVAHVLWGWGLRPGEHVAVAMANRVEFFEFCWAAHRIGLYYTAVNTHLAPDEARFVVNDCGARVLVVDSSLPELADALESGVDGVARRIVIGSPRAGHEDYETLRAPRAAHSRTRVRARRCSTPPAPPGPRRRRAPPDRRAARLGVRHPPADARHGVRRGHGADEPGPALPLRAAGIRVRHAPPRRHRADLRPVRRGAVPGVDAALPGHARAVRPDAFRADAAGAGQGALRPVVAGHGRARGSPVPTVGEAGDDRLVGPGARRVLRGHRGRGHDAARLAPVARTPWLGRAAGVHIVDESTGEELPTGETGDVYFSGGVQFRYHGDDAKTAGAYGPNGWSTLGDIGHVDADGYLYLSDRKSFTVISGGVNIYPQEAENVLIGHPLVGDVAAFGIPDPDLGEVLIAVVEPAEGAAIGPDSGTEILTWCRERLSRQKCPRRIEFRDRLPRADNGKLYKRVLRDEYASEDRPDW